MSKQFNFYMFFNTRITSNRYSKLTPTVSRTNRVFALRAISYTKYSRRFIIAIVVAFIKVKTIHIYSLQKSCTRNFVKRNILVLISVPPPATCNELLPWRTCNISTWKLNHVDFFTQRHFTL